MLSVPEACLWGNLDVVQSPSVKTGGMKLKYEVFVFVPIELHRDCAQTDDTFIFISNEREIFYITLRSKYRKVLA